MGLLLLGLSLLIFYIWRLWERAQGRTWKPEGHWEPRLKATHDYMDTLPALSTGEKVRRAIMITMILAVEGAFVLWVINARSN